MKELAEEVCAKPKMIGKVGWGELHYLPAREEETDTIQEGSIVTDFIREWRE